MNCIAVRGLCKCFKGNAPLFRGLDMDFPLGEVTVLTGPSGIGKTTLLSILMGLIPYDAGEILGVPRRQAAVFQENRLIPDLSAARNIALGCPGPLSRAVVLEHLGRVGLAESADAPACGLSGGMARRAAVVRACLAPSDILFMDEPFAGLDAVSARQTLEYILDVRKGRTLVAAVHERVHAEALGGDVLDLSCASFHL